jgi:electron transfer flavoprotein alpha subunit
MNTLVIAEHDNSSLKGATLNTIAAAGIVSGDVTIIIAGQDIGSVIE